MLKPTLFMCAVVLSGCVTLTHTKDGTDTIKQESRMALHGKYEALHGKATTSDMVRELGEPTLIQSRDGGVVGYGYSYNESNCESYNMFLYEKKTCDTVSIFFVAVFHNDVLQSSTLMDERDVSTSSAISASGLWELVYLNMKLTALGDILDDSLDRFARKHLGSR